LGYTAVNLNQAGNGVTYMDNRTAEGTIPGFLKTFTAMTLASLPVPQASNAQPRALNTAQLGADGNYYPKI
jgi:hypothetical protein